MLAFGSVERRLLFCVAPVVRFEMHGVNTRSDGARHDDIRIGVSARRCFRLLIEPSAPTAAGNFKRGDDHILLLVVTIAPAIPRNGSERKTFARNALNEIRCN